MNFDLIAGQFLTVTLPDGQSLEIDARDPADVTVWHCNAAGDAVASGGMSPASGFRLPESLLGCCGGIPCHPCHC
jgi:hypothetical protein